MNVLVTGANRGIGLQFVQRFLERGDHVIATARNPGAATDLNKLGVPVIALDVGSDASVEAFKKELGDQPLDIVINNAGVYGSGGTIGNFNFSEFERDFNVNTLGALRVTSVVRSNLKAGDAKKLINVTSKMGSIADNSSGGSYAYRISKTALNMATRCASFELKTDGISAIVIHPGWVQTDMGGSNASISTEQSVDGMLKVIDGMTLDTSGRFLGMERQRDSVVRL